MTEGAGFDLAAARKVAAEVFAPWIQDLRVEIVAVDSVAPADARQGWQPGGILRLPFSDKLCRSGGIVCGQALMALADTAMVIAAMAASGGFRPMTTVDQTSHFLRPVIGSDVFAEARIVRNGRTMSFGRITLRDDQQRDVAIATSAFALL